MNAYMLMYRQIDKERNVLPLKEDKFPSHIKVSKFDLTRIVASRRVAVAVYNVRSFHCGFL